MDGPGRGSLLLLCLALLVACPPDSKPVQQPVVEASGPAPEPSFNLVLYLIDTLRRDRLGFYGYHRNTSPNLDRLAVDSQVMEQATAPAPWTVPSVVSLMTSRQPLDHRIVEGGQKLPESAQTLAQYLQELGFTTAGFVVNPFAGKATGLHHGYDSFHKEPSAQAVHGWLDEIGKKPFFLYLHTAEPHTPYAPPPSLSGRFGDVSIEQGRLVHETTKKYRQLLRQAAIREQLDQPTTEEHHTALAEVSGQLQELMPAINVLYDGCVALADERVGAVVQVLRERGVWDRTVFLMLSDHGEEMFEHGGFEHGNSVHAELIRVPMLWRIPGQPGRRHQIPMTLLDVLPTILDGCGHAAGQDFAGSSLWPLLQGESGLERDEFVEAVRVHRELSVPPTDAVRGRFNVRVRSGKLRLIWNLQPDTAELFDLHQDPLEAHNLVEQFPAETERLMEVARQWVGQRPGVEELAEERKFTDPQGLDEATMSRLRELGYVE